MADLKTPSASGVLNGATGQHRGQQSAGEDPQTAPERAPVPVPTTAPPRAPKPQTSRLSVDLIVSDYAWLTEFAHQADVNLSDVVRELLSQCRANEDLAGRVRVNLWQSQGRLV